MRKLATGALGFSAAIYTSYYILPQKILPVTAIIIFLFSLTGLFLSGNLKKRVLIFCITAAIGFMWSYSREVVFTKPAEGMQPVSVLSIPQRAAQMTASEIDKIYSGDTAEFLKALLIGNREDLNKNAAVTATLTASGIMHIVAVSGMHISFLMSLLAQLIRNKRLFAVYAIPVLLFFMAMTGFTPAVTRAGIMQIFIICAPLLKREGDSITSLSAAVLVMLMYDPSACTSVSFQLSFAATLGIILFTARINRVISEFVGLEKNTKRLKKGLIDGISSSLSTTIGALIFTLPLSAIHFGYFSLVSPLTNLLTTGVVSLTFPLGLLSVAAGLIFEGLGEILAYPVTWGVQYILFIARVLAALPYAVVFDTSKHVVFWLIYVYAMFIIMLSFKARPRQYIYPVCIALITLFAVILVSLMLPQTDTESITVLDVGQGLCVVVKIDERTIVVDCGSNSTKKAGEITHKYLQETGCTQIDILALTHFHDDHINGVEFLLSRINAGTIVIPDPEGSFAADDIIDLARRLKTDIIYVTQTHQINIGETSIFIYPPLGIGDENEQGISYLIKGEKNTLITGDMNAAIERALLRYADLPQLDLLVVGHHGSKSSTSEELLQALMPKSAIISSGKNSFGHPHPETIERLLRYGVSVYRTDELGHITIGRENGR